MQEIAEDLVFFCEKRGDIYIIYHMNRILTFSVSNEVKK